MGKIIFGIVLGGLIGMVLGLIVWKCCEGAGGPGWTYQVDRMAFFLGVFFGISIGSLTGAVAGAATHIVQAIKSTSRPT
jgi:hypothetical protein